MLILRGITNLKVWPKYPNGALDEPPALEYASLLANMETTVPVFLNEVIAHGLEVLRANVNNDHLVAIQAIRKRTRVYVKDSTGNRQSHNAILPRSHQTATTINQNLAHYMIL